MEKRKRLLVMTKVAESPEAGGQEVGMGLFLTTIFIAGQMAGGGVLMVGKTFSRVPCLPNLFQPTAIGEKKQD